MRISYMILILYLSMIMTGIALYCAVNVDVVIRKARGGGVVPVDSDFPGLSKIRAKDGKSVFAFGRTP